VNAFPNPDDNADSLLSRSDRIRVGELLASLGKLTEPEIDRILALQDKKNLRFCEAALKLGLVQREDVHQALSLQFDYPYAAPAGSALSPLLVVAHDPFGAKAEAVRALRGQLALRWFDDRRKPLVVTATRGGSGSSVVAANLAVAFAQLGERTLLVDANLRRPAQHQLFGLGQADGLSSLLVGRGSLRELLSTAPPFATLAVLCAGAVPPNPHELLSTVRFSYTIETAPSAFDVVIIDAPPLLEYPDAQLIAARAGGCILVARRHKTTVADLDRAKQYLDPTGAAVLGAVLND
jgi:chain length determinant protein tyrosine kinase EpsG